MDENEATTLVTTNGLRVRVKAISYTLVDMAKGAIEKEWRERGELIDPPTYTVTTVAGVEETFIHDATTLDVKPDQTGIEEPAAAEAEAIRRSTANWAAWKAHKDARARLTAAQSRKSMRMLLRGLEVEETPGWEERQRADGIEVPTDPAERQYHYVMTEILVTPEDLFQATQKVTALAYRGLLKEEDIATAVASFRDTLQGATSRGLAGRQDTVEVQQQAGDAEGGEGVGPDAGPVAEPAG